MEVIEMARAMDVADEIISLAQGKDNPVSNLKLQKMMYFLNALSLVQSGHPLVDDGQMFEKWDYGPVIHSVYSEYSVFGASPILSPLEHQNIVFDDKGFPELQISIFNQREFEENNGDADFIVDNIDDFLNFRASQLVTESHKEPQWRDRSIREYSNNLTRIFYSDPINQFWR